MSTPHGRGDARPGGRGATGPDAVYTAPSITGPGLDGGVEVAPTAAVHLGDCLEVMRSLPDGSVDFVFTDPPYGHSQNDGDLAAGLAERSGREARPILNDGNEAHDLVRVVMPELRRLLGPGSCVAMCCAGGGSDASQSYAAWTLCMAEHFKFKQMIVWDKGPMGLGWHYRRSYEVVLVGQVPGAACRWFDTSKTVENVIRPGDHGIRKIIPKAGDHPTPKPVELVTRFLGLHTQPGDVVLDPFMGGGSTGVACARTGRSFIGAELDPGFFELARRRIEEAVMDLGHRGSLFEDLARDPGGQDGLFRRETVGGDGRSGDAHAAASL